MPDEFQIIDVEALAVEIIESVDMPVSAPSLVVGLSQGEPGPTLTVLALMARKITALVEQVDEHHRHIQAIQPTGA